MLAAGWTTATNLGYLVGPGTGTGQVLVLKGLHNGATLSTITVALSVTTAHSGVPASLPQLFVERYNVTAGGAVASVALSSSDPQLFTPAPGTGAAWVAGNVIQPLVYTCNQNNVIDTSQYLYIAVLYDENGANSQSGNKYLSVAYGYTAIADMRFQ